MNRNAISFFASALLIAMAIGSTSFADVKLPAVLNSHMVLQRGLPVQIWGWADAGEEISVTLGESVAKTTTDKSGQWATTLPAMDADGKTYSMTVKGKNTILLEDILIGDVWIGSGQSNMEWQLKSTQGGQEAIANATHANIRLLHVPKTQAKTPASDVAAKWKKMHTRDHSRFLGRVVLLWSEAKPRNQRSDRVDQ